MNTPPTPICVKIRRNLMENDEYLHMSNL